jgi:hypothetical protein
MIGAAECVTPMTSPGATGIVDALVLIATVYPALVRLSERIVPPLISTNPDDVAV